MTKPKYQPKDTGKLTNVHYGTDQDERTEEALTPNGTTKVNNKRK